MRAAPSLSSARRSAGGARVPWFVLFVRFRKRARSSRPLGGFPHSGSATDYRIVSTSATPCLPGSGMSDGRKCARRLPHFCIGWAARSLAGRGRRARRSFCASGRKFPCAAPSCPVSSFLASGRGRIRKASAGVAELADAYGSGPYGGNPMKVQVLSPAPLVSPLKPQVKGLGFLLLAGGPLRPPFGDGGDIGSKRRHQRESAECLMAGSHALSTGLSAPP